MWLRQVGASSILAFRGKFHFFVFMTYQMLNLSVVIRSHTGSQRQPMFIWQTRLTVAMDQKVGRKCATLKLLMFPNCQR